MAVHIVKKARHCKNIYFILLKYITRKHFQILFLLNAYQWKYSGEHSTSLNVEYVSMRHYWFLIPWNFYTASRSWWSEICTAASSGYMRIHRWCSHAGRLLSIMHLDSLANKISNMINISNEAKNSIIQDPIYSNMLADNSDN